MNTDRIGSKLRQANSIADRIRVMRRKRVEQAFREANLGDVNMCSLHNFLNPSRVGYSAQPIGAT